MLSSKIRAVIDQHPEFSGVVLVQQAGETVFEGAYGRANRADDIPNTVSTRFATASGTKTFTSLAVCQLVEQGKLSFDTLLNECVTEDYPQKDAPVTLHHVLSHTSGLPDYYDEEQSDEALLEVWAARTVARVRHPRDVLSLFPDRPLKFAPGTGFSYNNGAYVLLGLVIEGASGMSYHDYVTEHVFRRAGMENSGFFPLDELPSGTAQGYMEPQGLRTNVYALPELALPDGGAFVTAPDMAHFWDAMRNHRLLSPENTARMMQPHTQAPTHGSNRWYGYGLWMTRDGDDVVQYDVLGGDAGVGFLSRYAPGSDLVATVACNDSMTVWPLLHDLGPLL